MGYFHKWTRTKITVSTLKKKNHNELSTIKNPRKNITKHFFIVFTFFLIKHLRHKSRPVFSFLLSTLFSLYKYYTRVNNMNEKHKSRPNFKQNKLFQWWTHYTTINIKYYILYCSSFFFPCEKLFIDVFLLNYNIMLISNHDFQISREYRIVVGIR